MLVVPAMIAAGLFLGSFVAGGIGRATVALALTLLATAVGVVVLLPWRVVHAGAGWGLGTLAAGDDRWRFGRIVRFATGPHGDIPLGLAVIVVVVVAVLVARGERLGWVVRGVVLGTGSLLVALAGSRGHLGSRPPEIEVLLAPAAVALVLVASAATAAFDHDVRGKSFSWRQPLSFLAAAAVVLAAVPSLLAAGDGRFGLPGKDLVRPLRFLPPEPAGGGGRLLWVARPADLPPSSWPLGNGIAYAITSGRGPSIVDLWSDNAGDGEGQVATDLALVADGQTDRVGHLLAPMGVRFVVVVSAQPAAIGGGNGTAVAVEGREVVADPVASASPALLSGLSSQLDLRRVQIDNRLVVYENTAWLPITAQLDDLGAQASRQAGDDVLVRAELTGATAVLPVPAGHIGGQGPVAAGTVFLARPFDRRWSLRVGKSTVHSQPAFGWATSFDVPTAGDASLRHATPLLRRLAVLLQLCGWLIVARLTRPIDRMRRRRGRPRTMPTTPTTPRTSPPGVSRRATTTRTRPPEEPELSWADEPTDGAGERHRVRSELRVPDELALKWADDDRRESP